MSASFASKAGHTLAYSAIGLATLATGVFTLSVAALSFEGSNCGNTSEMIRGLLHVVAPIGVAITFGLWSIAYKCGARHPIGRTLFFLCLALWIFGSLISRVH